MSRCLVFLGLLVVTIPLPLLAHAEDLRLLPGCHPVFGCETGEMPAAQPASPVLVPPSAPLFTPDIVARDTSPEMLTLLNSPTLEHAQAFVAKERERLQATMDAQRLIDAVKAGRRP